MRISTAEAEAFFAHPSQRKAAMLDGPLPDLWYHAAGPVCGAFHWIWPGVLMGHLGVKAAGWGATLEPARAVLAEAWETYAPDRIVGWVKESNRSTCRWTERLGFTVDGRLPLPEPYVLYGWRR